MKVLILLFLSLFVLACRAQVDGCQFYQKIGYNNVFDCPARNFGTFKQLKAVKASSWQACAKACAKMDSQGCKAFSFSGPKKSCMISFAEPDLKSLKKASGITAGYLVDSSDK